MSLIPFVPKQKKDTLEDVKRKIAGSRVGLRRAFEKVPLSELTDDELRLGIEGSRQMLATAARSIERNNSEIEAFIAEIERRRDQKVVI